MKGFFCFVIVLFSNFSYSQSYLEYYKLVNDAEIAVLDSKREKADSIYSVAFSSVKRPFKEDLFLAAQNADFLKKESRVNDCVRKASLLGLKLKRIKSLKFFRKTKSYKRLKAEYDDLHNKFLKSIDINLKNEIAQMLKKDQKTRTPIFGSANQSSKVDKYNYGRLLELIKGNNDKWLGFSLIGETVGKTKYDVSNNIALMLLHFKKDEIENLKPYMLEAVLNGEMYPYHYARIIDYLNILNCQIYGTYIDGGLLVDICDCEKANKKREKIGFESIKDYYRKRNSTYKCKE